MSMSKTEKLNKMAIWRVDLNEKVEEYNAALAENKLDKVVALNDDISQIVKDYNGMAKSVLFEEAGEIENPVERMLWTIKKLQFKIVRVRDKTDPETKAITREVIDADTLIDLAAVHRHVKGGIGANSNWINMIEKLNLLLTIKTATALNANQTKKMILENYSLSDAARAYELGKDPTSNTNMLRTLTAIVAAMLGEGYKPTSHDVKFLEMQYTSKSKSPLAVKCATHKFLRGYIAAVCNRIVLDKKYDVEYKTIS